MTKCEEDLKPTKNSNKKFNIETKKYYHKIRSNHSMTMPPKKAVTILSDKWVISSREIDEPIPSRRQSEKYRGAPQCGRDRRRPFWIGEIGLTDDIDILGSFENGD